MAPSPIHRYPYPMSPPITPQQQAQAEEAIQTSRQSIDYRIVEYSLETIGRRHQHQGFIRSAPPASAPWPQEGRSQFIESLLLGLPVAPLVLAQLPETWDGDRLEIIDGLQRIQTIADFIANGWPLAGLTTLPCLNDFYFRDLSGARQRRFLRTQIPIMLITEGGDRAGFSQVTHRLNTKP